MLTKLLKYEFKATYRLMTFFCLALLIISAIIGFSLMNGIDAHIYSLAETNETSSKLLTIFFGLMFALFTGMILVVSCAPFFYAINRFKKTVFGNEGYLLHTLPVKSRDILISEISVFTFWFFISTVVMFGSCGLVLAGARDSMTYKKITEALGTKDFIAQLGKNIIPALWILIISYLVSSLKSTTHLMASISVGYTSHCARGIKSIGAFFALNIAGSILQSLLLSAIPGIATNYTVYMWGVISSEVIVSGAFFALSYHMVTKRLNLK